MAIALLSVGLLGLLIFILGMNVSRERRSVTVTQHEAEADPKSGLRKAIRAHGNCIEYVPMLSLMILALGLRFPIMPMWISVLIIIAVVSRYMHAVTIIKSDNIYQATTSKFIAAAGTYVAGSILAIILIAQSISLF